MALARTSPCGVRSVICDLLNADDRAVLVDLHALLKQHRAQAANQLRPVDLAGAGIEHCAAGPIQPELLAQFAGWMNTVGMRRWRCGPRLRDGRGFGAFVPGVDGEGPIEAGRRRPGYGGQ